MAKYIITEMQTNAEGTTAFLHDQKDDRNEAESVYFLKCSSAAISQVPVHTVTLETNDGFQILKQTYMHEPAPNNS
jgi:hypothetical protein